MEMNIVIHPGKNYTVSFVTVLPVFHTAPNLEANKMDIQIKAEFTGTENDRKLLSNAEWRVFLMHCEGWTKKQIADYICRSPDTVRTQEQAIREKTASKSITQAILKAVAKGIVTITTLCLMLICAAQYYTDTEQNQEQRRAPRVSRNVRNRTFRDYLV